MNCVTRAVGTQSPCAACFSHSRRRGKRKIPKIVGRAARGQSFPPGGSPPQKWRVDAISPNPFSMVGWVTANALCTGFAAGGQSITVLP